MIKLYSYSQEETEEFGEKIGAIVEAGMIILLRGDLGTGKTVIARGVARGLGIGEPITSPTYTLIHEYKGRLPLYHFDIYRLSHEEEMYDIGYEEFFYGRGVAVVEWPERMGDLIPSEYLDISIEKENPLEGNKRIIKLVPVGEKYEMLKKDLV